MLAIGVPLVCSVVLLAGAAALLVHSIRGASARPLHPAMRVVLPLLGVIYVAGIWWGVPWRGWAPDEIPPSVFLDAIDRHFAHGWHDKYPPVHFYLNAALYLPFVVAARAGRLDLTTNAVQIVLLLVSRALSLLMAIGSIVALYIVADDLYGPPGSVFAAAIGGVTLPFVYYAKLANVDVPYLFWFAWSMVFYVRLIRRERTVDAFLFALTAVTAVETKDQAYGFYVLPMLHVAFTRRRTLPVTLATGLAAFVLESNVLFNPSGFVEHVRAVAGVGGDLNRQPDASVGARLLTLARLTSINLGWSMTWPGVLAAIAGIVAEIRLRRFLWLLLPVISYAMFFLTTITSVFDRYLLGVYMILAVFAGAWIGALVRADAPNRRARLLLCAAGTVLLAWYGASIDLMMLKDSRYPAQRWLRERPSADARVALIGPRAYLPGVDSRQVVRGLSSPAGTAPAELPDFLVVNTQVMRRQELPAL
ncbi:MAG TPA: glycosyltransferase family 39 protein, partial [Vicinamibacterales bacterium]